MKGNLALKKQFAELQKENDFLKKRRHSYNNYKTSYEAHYTICIGLAASFGAFMEMVWADTELLD